jgi:hypothetical protein
MTTARVSPAPTICLALGLAAATAGVGWWQQRVRRAPVEGIASDPWEQVKAQYPLSDQEADIPRLTPEAMEAVVAANPFSPKRRFVPTPEGGDPPEGGAEPLPEPVFTYKGRINMGKRQRAVVEDTATKKTYFLEVGQEVAGFKVLDISESQVLLSDLATSEQLAVSLTSSKSQ